MKNNKTNTNRPSGHPAESTPIFVPRQEGTVEVGLDDCLDLIVEAQEEASALKKKLDNLKKVAKDLLAAKGLESYESPEGHKALWSSRQQPSYNRELIQEKCPEAISFKVVKSFTVK